jgi:hypothetical protein
MLSFFKDDFSRLSKCSSAKVSGDCLAIASKVRYSDYARATTGQRAELRLQSLPRSLDERVYLWCPGLQHY